MGDRGPTLVTGVTVDHLVNNSVSLREEHDMMSLENIVNEIVEHHDQQVFILVVLNRIPNINDLLLDKSEIVLALNLYGVVVRVDMGTYQLLDHKICERLLLDRIHEHEQKLIYFRAEVFHWYNLVFF